MGGAGPIWSQVCWWQLGALGCLNHDLGGKGEVKSCTPVGQLAGWEGEDLALELVHSQGSAHGALPGAGGERKSWQVPCDCQGVQEAMGDYGTPHLLSVRFSQWPLTLLGSAVPFPKGVL